MGGIVQRGGLSSQFVFFDFLLQLHQLFEEGVQFEALLFFLPQQVNLHSSSEKKCVEQCEQMSYDVKHEQDHEFEEEVPRDVRAIVQAD